MGTYACLYFQVDALEQDASEVLSMVRSIKNTFAPINRIPPEVLSLIPDFYCDPNEGLIELTHVCRHWREIFISRASLWTFLDCVDLDQTRIYLERSKMSPLEMWFARDGYHPFPDDTLLLIAPHVGRLKALTLLGPSKIILKFINHFGSPAPLLEELDIQVCSPYTTVSEGALFGGNLSSLRELRLSGVLNLPWGNLPNLTVFDFRWAPGNGISVTQLLDFFEGAPLLREVKLENSLPKSFDAPDGRVVSLPHLRLLRISAQPVHSILLNHLRVPTGALATLEFLFNSDRAPILDYLPRSLDNLRNVSHITSINLNFNSGMAMRLKGPSGELYVVGLWVDAINFTFYADDQTLRPLNLFPISTTERLVVREYHTSVHSKTETSCVCQTLLLMNDLRTLTLTNCTNNSFIFALNPKNTANVACSKLEELILYLREQQEESCVDELLEMARERASRGAKLSAIVIVCPRELIPSESVFSLRSYVSRVEYTLDDRAPGWDTLPGEAGVVYDSDW